MTHATVRLLLAISMLSLCNSLAAAQSPAANENATSASTPEVDPASKPASRAPYQLGAYAEVDLGILAFLRQGTAIAGGVKYGPFRAGLSYASFLSSGSLGGVPKGFDLRVNYLVGFNFAYFIAQRSDTGFYVQAMLHLKQQGVTNKASGAHVDLASVALGLELGYLWKMYKGLYIAPRVGALYYVDKPQPHNQPVRVGDRDYDNDRHKNWDTYFIPTLSLGYSW